MSLSAFQRRRRELAAKARKQTETEQAKVADSLDGNGKPEKPKRTKGGDSHAGN